MPRLKSPSSEDEKRDFFRAVSERLRKGRLLFDERVAPEKQPKQPPKKIRETLRPLRDAMEGQISYKESVLAIAIYAQALEKAYPLGTPISHAAQTVLAAIREYELWNKTELDSRESTLCEIFRLLLWNLSLADVGIRPLSGGKKGLNLSRGTAEQRQLKKQAYRAAFADLHTKRPNLSKEQCYENIAKKFEVSSKTIKRAVLQK